MQERIKAETNNGGVKIALFSYAILPKSFYEPPKVKYNNQLDSKYCLTGLSILETYAGYLAYKQINGTTGAIILGCHTFGNEAPADSELMGKYLQKLGVPDNRIQIQTEGPNTVFQIEQLKDLVGAENKTPIIGVTLECHSERTFRLAQSHGLKMEILSVEEVLQRYSKDITEEIRELLVKYKSSQTKQQLESEAKLLLLMQTFDPQGHLQKIITHFRGIRYFDIDILPTSAKTMK